jgi:hypothetical protein
LLQLESATQQTAPERTDMCGSGPCHLVGGVEVRVRPATRLFCGQLIPRGQGRRCQSLITALPGQWVKTRVLDPGEMAADGHGVVFCANRECKAKWEIREVRLARTPRP